MTSTSEDQSLMQALDVLLAHENRKGAWIDEAVDLSFTNERWKRSVLVKTDGGERVSRPHCEVCVFSALAAEIKSGDVSIQGSEAYADYREQLLSWEDWEPLVADYCAQLGFSADAAGFARSLRTGLTEVAPTVLDTLAERIPVVVGVSGPSLRLMADLTRQVMDMGAAGVMVAPMPTLRTDEAIARYYSEVVAALGPVPMCLQDYPQTLGVHFSLPVLIRIFREHPSICMFKHEDNPGLNKLSRFRAAGENEIGRRISILVGNGGLFLPQELARGADGAMTGFAFPEMLRRVVDLHEEGKPDDAETLFDAYLPLVRYELQPGLGLAIRKHILARRGAIACAALRAPGPTLTNTDVAEIDRLWTRKRRRLVELGEPASE